MSTEAPISALSFVVRSREIAEAERDGEVMALNIDRGACYGLNRMSSHIWKLFAQPERVADVCARLTAEYEVDPATCERQVLDLLEELRGGGLVEVTSAPASPGVRA